MATVAPSGGGVHASSEKRDGGTVVNAGNPASDSPATKNLTLIDLADDFGTDFDARIYANDGTGASTTDRVGISGALAAGSGTVGYTQTATHWIMRGGNVTNGVAGETTGLSSTVFATAGADYNGLANSGTTIHSLLTTRALGSGDSTSFNVYAVPSTELVPGRVIGSGAGNVVNYVAPSGAGDVAATDDAANPTLSVPGELTYHWGSGAKPVSFDYKAKDTFES